MNQWQSPVSGVPAPNLADIGRSAARAHRSYRGGRLRMPGEIAGTEAMVMDCGVAMARLPGHSWAPSLSTGRMSERGNRLGSPSWLAIHVASGQVRRRLMTRRRDGASVLVVGVVSEPPGADPHAGWRGRRRGEPGAYPVRWAGRGNGLAERLTPRPGPTLHLPLQPPAIAPPRPAVLPPPQRRPEHQPAPLQQPDQ